MAPQSREWEDAARTLFETTIILHWLNSTQNLMMYIVGNTMKISLKTGQFNFGKRPHPIRKQNNSYIPREYLLHFIWLNCDIKVVGVQSKQDKNLILLKAFRFSLRIVNLAALLFSKVCTKRILTKSYNYQVGVCRAKATFWHSSLFYIYHLSKQIDNKNNNKCMIIYQR